MMYVSSAPEAPALELRFEECHSISEFIAAWSLAAGSSDCDPRVLQPSDDSASRQHLYRVVHDDKVIGTARITLGQGLAGVSLLAVRNDARGLGFGEGLIRKACRLALDHSNCVYFQVDHANDIAHRLYEKIGAEVACEYGYWAS